MKAIEMLHILKTQNKRLFIIWLVTFIAFIGLLGYTIYLLNDIGTEETTTETTNEQIIEDTDTIENSYIINGGIYGENKAKDNNQDNN